MALVIFQQVINRLDLRKKWDTTSNRPAENRVKSSLVINAMVTYLDEELSHTVVSRVVRL